MGRGPSGGRGGFGRQDREDSRGGRGRDEQLGIPVTERDWCVVGATPDELLQQGYKPVGKDFPVFLHPESGEEYALARTERKTATG